MSPQSRAIASLSLSVSLLVAACGGDKVDGFVDPGDADASQEVFLPDSSPDTVIPVEIATDSDGASEETGTCPGCTGAPCSGNGDCNSGYCLEGPNGQECVRTCSDECPTGYACRGVTNAGGDPTFLCLYEHIAYCAPCDIDGDCETGIGGVTGAKCMPADAAHPEAGSFCRTVCTPGTCPNGATCEAVEVGGVTASLCRPGTINTAGECACSVRSVALTLSTSCSAANAFGTCEGERVCGAVGPVPACDAAAAIAELCNAKDDDCDGDTDEDFADKNAPCDGADDDSCKGGIFVCGDDGSLVCTDDALSEVERCDGIDNDCDGETDETFVGVGDACDGPDADSCKDGILACDGLGLVCNDGPETATTGVELCNGVDDNCNNEVDEGFSDKGQPCDGEDADGCREGVWLCNSDGSGLMCNDDAVSRTELCNELDDDCQNGPDDTFLDKLKPCDGPDGDACADGIWVCAPDQLGLACTDDAISKIEVCNDLDDDCDGQTDEDFPLKGQDCDSEVDTDVCATGKWVCGGNTLVCDDDAASLVETCNGMDDDCDGLTDGMDGDLADELNPNQQGACAGSVQACAGANGYVPDYTAITGYGQPETPNAQYGDENCDGIDGDITRAAFVAAGASNSGTCTKAAPCGSVTYAVTQTNSSRPHVYVQAGTYTEVVEIPTGANVEIYGGFNTNWVRKARTELGHKVTLKGVKHAGDGEYMAVRVRNATVKLADLVIQAASPGSEERKNGAGLSSYGVHSVDGTVTLERVEVIQGNGATGADGTAGTNAPNLTAPPQAQPGGNGTQSAELCNSSDRGLGSSGATNGMCGDGTAGGRGGDGGLMDAACVDCGSCGIITLCGLGGICGSVDLGICTATAGNCLANNGTAGTSGTGPGAGGGGPFGVGGSSCTGVGPGNPGGTPSHGLGGSGGTRGGSIVAGFWSPGSGLAGTLGANGSGGGGGGGAGGCDQNNGVALQNSSGPGGGGGGAGGCRAQAPGTAGAGGGASFGIMASGGIVTVVDCRFVLGNGAAGGIGGSGGNGQPGGAGGNGGLNAGSAQPGAPGGKGGDGGASGGGGGGAGGSSYGVYTRGTQVSIDNTSNFDGGSAGAGGQGGLAQQVAGAPGNGKPGQIGRTESVAVCTAANACGD